MKLAVTLNLVYLVQVYTQKVRTETPLPWTYRPSIVPRPHGDQLPIGDGYGDHVFREYAVQYPYKLPPGKVLPAIETMYDCYCPRVYWPACGMNGVTYVNACVMNCINTTSIRRYLVIT